MRNLPSHWRRGRIKWDTVTVAGATPSTDDDAYWLEGDDPKGTPFVAIADMSRRERVTATAKSLSSDGMATRNMPIGQAGTLLLAMYASVGELAFLDLEATWNQALLGITADPNKVDARFLRYALLDMRDDLLREVRSNTQANLNAGQVGDVWFQKPPLAEQRAIADYLDRETARIDTLIEEQRRLVTLLVDRKRAVLDEVTSTATGIQIRLRFLFAPSSEANHPDEEVLSVYRDYGVIPKSSRGDNFNRTPENVGRYLLVRPGDLVVNRMKAWQGSLGISSYRGIVSGDYEVATPLTDRLLPRFAHLFLRSPKMIAEYAIRSTGIRPSQWRLYWDEMGDIEVAVPSHDEQAAIVVRLDEQTAKIDTLIAETERFIELSKERRAALITATVTGQIDVRGRCDG